MQDGDHLGISMDSWWSSQLTGWRCTRPLQLAATALPTIHVALLQIWDWTATSTTKSLLVALSYGPSLFWGVGEPTCRIPEYNAQQSCLALWPLPWSCFWNASKIFEVFCNSSRLTSEGMSLNIQCKSPTVFECRHSILIESCARRLTSYLPAETGIQISWFDGTSIFETHVLVEVLEGFIWSCRLSQGSNNNIYIWCVCIYLI